MTARQAATMRDRIARAALAQGIPSPLATVEEILGPQQWSPMLTTLMRHGLNGHERGDHTGANTQATEHGCPLD